MTEADKRIDQLFRQASQDAGLKPFLVLEDGRICTYGEVFERARRLAQSLVASGVERGDRILCLMRNSQELIEFYIACGLCGGVAVALNTLSTRREVERIMADCTPSVVFAQQEFQTIFPEENLPASVKLKVVTSSAPVQDLLHGWVAYDNLLASAQGVNLPDDQQPAEAAIMIYSSGTTGLPKGILLSHQALIDNALSSISVLGVRTTDRWLSLLPLFSSFGFAFDFLHVGLVRGSVVILPRFDEKRAVELIELHRVTFMAGVPTMFARIFDPQNIADHDITSLRLIDVGGGPVSLRLKQMLDKDAGVRVVESYGLTEISPVASIQDPARPDLSSSCGAPLPGFEVKVVDAQGNTMPADTPGELLFRSPTFMIGYWGQEQQTRQALTDGWLHTGDVGRIDHQGEIHILDRTKDVMVVNGFNVYPKEVENCIAEVEGVQAVAVVSYPDEIRGETIHAFVVPKSGKSLDPKVIQDHCSNSLSKFKVPRGVTVIDEMPLTASGKVQRFRLREMIVKQQTNQP